MNKKYKNMKCLEILSKVKCKIKILLSFSKSKKGILFYNSTILPLSVATPLFSSIVYSSNVKIDVSLVTRIVFFFCFVFVYNEEEEEEEEVDSDEEMNQIHCPCRNASLMKLEHEKLGNYYYY